MEKNNSSISFRHYRQLQTVGDKRVISSRGGATVAYVGLDKDDTKAFAAAVAYCNPSDNFQYVYGRNKARGRLVQAASNNFKEVDNDKTFYLETEDRDAFLEEMDSLMETFNLTHL